MRVTGQHRSYISMIGVDIHREVLCITTENGGEEETLSRFKNSLRGMIKVGNITHMQSSL